MATVMLKKIGDFPADAKVPPQLKVIVDAMGKYANGVDRAQLAKEIEADLKTRQPAERVITFYQKRLVDEKVAEVTKIGAEKKEPAEKKAKSPAPAKGKPAAQAGSVAA